MRITSKGQVTIPAEIRERAGLLPGTDVAFRSDGDRVWIEKARPPVAGSGARKGGETRGEEMVRLLRGSATVKLGNSTEEIMRLLRGDPD